MFPMKTALNFNTFQSTKLTATTIGISNYTIGFVTPLDTHAHSFNRPQPWQTSKPFRAAACSSCLLLFQVIPTFFLQKPEREKLKECSC